MLLHSMTLIWVSDSRVHQTKAEQSSNLELLTYNGLAIRHHGVTTQCYCCVTLMDPSHPWIWRISMEIGTSWWSRHAHLMGRIPPHHIHGYSTTPMDHHYINGEISLKKGKARSTTQPHKGVAYLSELYMRESIEAPPACSVSSVGVFHACEGISIVWLSIYIGVDQFDSVWFLLNAKKSEFSISW